MRDVIFILKFMEALLCIVCIGLHVSGISYTVEPLPHIMYFCGIYVGFFLMCTTGMAGEFLLIFVLLLHSTLDSTMFVLV